MRHIKLINTCDLLAMVQNIKLENVDRWSVNGMGISRIDQNKMRVIFQSGLEIKMPRYDLFLFYDWEGDNQMKIIPAFAHLKRLAI